MAPEIAAKAAPTVRRERPVVRFGDVELIKAEKEYRKYWAAIDGACGRQCDFCEWFGHDGCPARKKQLRQAAQLSCALLKDDNCSECFVRANCPVYFYGTDWRSETERHPDHWMEFIQANFGE